MANFYLSMKIGNVGSGAPHSDYILGQGKYEYKQEEIVYTDAHLPEWAKDATDFFKHADMNERANSENNICKGRVYRELEVSLAHELTLEQNIDMLNDFIKKELGDDHYYSVSIHDKESSYKGDIKNIHAHVMFSERKLDGIERTPETFFKRANPKYPERGGCKKNAEWKEPGKLTDIRKSWELFQNKHLEKAGLDITVSCERLEKQRELALEKGDVELAKTLDRTPINCPGYILQKLSKGQNLNTEEQLQYDDFQRAREIRDITIELYQLEKMRDVMLEQKANIADLNNNINSIGAEVNNNYELKDLVDNVQAINLEIIKAEHTLSSSLDSLALNNIVPEYQMLKDKFDYLTTSDSGVSGDGADVASIAERLKAMEDAVDPKTFNEVKNELQDDIKDRLASLNISKSMAEEKLTDYVNNKWTGDNEHNIFSKLEAEFNSNLSLYTALKTEIFKDQKELDNLARMSSPENKELTALNIISKGEYSKLTKAIGKLAGEIDYLKAKIEHDMLSPKETLVAKDKLDKLIQKNDDLSMKYNDLKERLNTPGMKSQKIKIIHGLDKKYRDKESSLLSSIREKTLSADLLKTNLIDTEKTRDKVHKYIKDEQTNISFMKNSLEKSKAISANIGKNFSDENILMLAQNKVTGGQTRLLINEYTTLKEQKKIIEKRLDELGSSSSSKLFNYNEIKKLRDDLKNIDNKMININDDYVALKKSIPEERLNEEILKLKDLKETILDSYSKEQKELGGTISDSYKNVEFAKEILDNSPKLSNNLTKGKYLGSVLDAFRSKNENGQVVGSASAQLGKSDLSDEMDF